jgi:hypothetical protein
MKIFWGRGTVLQARWLRVRFHMTSLDILNLLNPSGRTMPLGLTQPLTEMNNTNLLCGGGGGGEVWRDRKKNNFTAIFKPIV